MLKRTVLLLGLFWLLLGGISHAQVVNAKGTSSAPISVTNGVSTVLDFKSGRKGWCLIPETVAIRCMPSGSSAAASPAPSATVGFYFPANVISCHNNVPVISAIANAQQMRLDCFSTGAATNVDTWEE